MVPALLDSLKSTLRSLCVQEKGGTEPLKKIKFQKGDTFQIYTVKNRALRECVDLEGHPATVARSKIFKKWISPLLPSLEGKTFCVHLGDRPCNEIAEGIPNLCYSKKKSDERDLRLIPDPYYQGQKGYVRRREYRCLYKTEWDRKIEQVVFRGAYTGEKPLEKNMRAQLCALETPLVDAKITGVNNAWEEDEVRHLFGERLTKYAMAQYKYQIDIDGNTNSWDGFFWKLMSGSLTFKLPSEWYQWYYPRIQADTHYVEFVDFDDLVEKVIFYKKHDTLAREIAFNARDFTRSFRFKDQYTVLWSALND